ncbi:MAG: c-type cytochrome [candidate division KSB1 bacterium]|nr:c-type cytochrome [candidate division KSB1 bacterium]
MCKTLSALFFVTVTLCSALYAQKVQTGQDLLLDLGCHTCHSGLETPDEAIIRERAPDLSNAGLIYEPGYLLDYLQNPKPVRSDIGASRMPDFGFSDAEALAVVLFLRQQTARDPNLPATAPVTLAEADRKRLARQFDRAKKSHPAVTAELGKAIFRAQNCMACHRIRGMAPWPRPMAPDLARVMERLQEPWLRAYLKKPHAVRPLGFFPGSGSRMPNFHLTDEEIERLLAYFKSVSRATASKAAEPAPLSSFAMKKARALLRDKLSCLGCHRLGERGGRIGPDLSSLAARIMPGYLQQIVRDPQRAMPGTIMPKIRMVPVHEKTADLIIRFLWQQREPRQAQPYFSLVDFPPVLPEGGSRAERLYKTYCAICHGVSGNGDGYNARFLHKTPVVFASTGYMATRPDDTLFDGIFSGGYILNKSPMMPPWGGTLSVDDMRLLVQYLRQLCQCQGPAWSRDGQR